MVNGRLPETTPDRLFTGLRGWITALVCVLAVALCLSQLTAVAGRTGLLGKTRVGSAGMGYHPSSVAPGWLTVDHVDRGGAAELAGIRPGGLIRFDKIIASNPPPGAIAGLTAGEPAHGPPAKRSSGPAVIYGVHHVWLHFAAMPRMDTPAARPALWLSIIGGGLFAIALGVVVLWRGWGNRAALALGLGLIGYVAGADVPWWMTVSDAMPLFLAGIVLLNCCSIGLLVLPVLLYDKAVARVGWRAWLVVGLVATLAACELGFSVVIAWRPWPLPPGIANAIAALLVVGPGVSVYWAWRGMRDGSGAVRNRFTVLLLADALVVIGALLSLVAGAGLQSLHGSAQFTIETASTLIASVVFPLLLAYALLRHRVIDLGFVVNRTLAFGSISALLLGCFGLIEWGVEHWLPESWVKASVWIDAGAALLVYLAFHRVHEAVENRVEHVFFRGWHANEAILRRFVASAPHFEDERALARSFADELSRFSGDARVALYRRRDRTHDAILERMAGSWDTAPRTLPVDDPAFALMRAERRAIDLSDTLTDLPGVLALPMLDHGVLSGLVLLDLKGPGALYRPDEVDVLGWAAHDVALAMAALHAGQIEAENRLLKAQLARLGSLIADRLDHAEI
ncbi:hypothetical protein [Novosphingobium sp.]|uniref:hypothetical protein n=1 Tax=Novosphingobium sp. TaxID=1874826 RepID=UPI003B51707E